MSVDYPPLAVLFVNCSVSKFFSVALVTELVALFRRSVEAEEERICRYCFAGPDDDDNDEELISPCQCKGGQKWVHLSCLRKWQRLVLVSQPTHPRFYADDPRHHTCNVCKAAFTCAPPTRLELMSSFTGPELGALIQSECVIGSHQTFSEELS